MYSIFNGKTKYYYQIDLVKFLAIVAVILLHSVSKEALLKSFAPFHIWQAVPLFMLVAGVNSALASRGRIADLRAQYSKAKFAKYVKRLMLPYVIFFVCQILYAIYVDGRRLDLPYVFERFISGGSGPGSYFVPLFVQHVLVFPAFLWVQNKISKSDGNLILFWAFVFSIAAEFLCSHYRMDTALYRLFYLRYFFAAALGSHIVLYGLNNFYLILSAFSFLFILNVYYLRLVSFKALFYAWSFQHAPAYFYTLLMFLGIWKLYPFVSAAGKIISYFGRASFHIFLAQTFYFWKFAPLISKTIENDILLLVANVSICLLVGGMFFSVLNYLEKNTSNLMLCLVPRFFMLKWSNAKLRKQLAIKKLAAENEQLRDEIELLSPSDKT